MTASTLWSDAPKNRHAAERSGNAVSATPRDAHAVRRQSTALAAGLFLVVNLAVLASLAPAAINTLASAVTLTDLHAPRP